MENKLAQAAIENFKNGYSCSESIVKAAYDLGIIKEDLISVSTAFSGGMSSGCLCGAIAGSQMVIGAISGRDKSNNARANAKEFIDEFKSVRKVTCCKALTANLEFSSPERKNHCINIVGECGVILDEIAKKEFATR